MPCPMCEKRGQDWEGDAPVCAFESDTFVSDNWNCATLNKLRKIAEENRCWEFQETGTYSLRYSDISLAVIPFSANLVGEVECQRFIVLSWYKGRGRTGQAWLFCDDDAPKLLTLEAAMACIQDYEERAT